MPLPGRPRRLIADREQLAVEEVHPLLLLAVEGARAPAAEHPQLVAFERAIREHVDDDIGKRFAHAP